MAKKRKRAKIRNKKNNRPKQNIAATQPGLMAWVEQDGIHALIPGVRPAEAQIEEMNLIYQEKLRHTPLWDEMIKQFGREKAEEVLKQCRIDIK